MAKHDWDKIKQEYVEGVVVEGQLVFPSKIELSKKYNIEKAFLSKKAKADQWDTQREIYNNRITEKRQQKKSDVISGEGSKFDLDCFNAAKDGAEKVAAMIQRCVVIEDVNKLSAALKNFQAVGKASLGDKDALTDATLTIRWDTDGR